MLGKIEINSTISNKRPGFCWSCTGHWSVVVCHSASLHAGHPDEEFFKRTTQLPLTLEVHQERGADQFPVQEHSFLAFC